MTQPLRPSDPRRLGPYELLARLGEGGMGTVYLGRAPGGRQVAVKVVRAEYAPDDEFRRRFRSEVNRARQVPPFCTAEVLDADPDHERPYLVVEYVDGPSLAEVVEQQGPLTAGSLHSVAIGVATALSAIHGAGVIHRDLKPRNVLFGLGSPKVIDFGIARALEVTSQHTRTDQMVGTVAYMAPERFDSSSRALTTAADIFAWGAVVTYAGTGRTPFAADSPPATAARILTQPPALSGLSGPLRDLVALALAKDPDERPTARELLDLLLTAGPQDAPALTGGLDQRPALRQAVEAAHATSRQSTGEPFRQFAHRSAVDVPRARPLPTSAPPIPVPAPVPMSVPAPVSKPGRRRWPIAVAVAAVLAALLLVGCAIAGSVLLAEVGTGSGTVGLAPGEIEPEETPAGEDPSASDPEPASTDGSIVVADPLVAPGSWTQRSDDAERSTCSFDDALVVVRRTTGSYRCPGPRDVITGDHRISVDVTVDTADTCASIWFLFAGTSGYRARVCAEFVDLGTHKGNEVTTLYAVTLERFLEPGVVRRVVIEIRDRIASLSLDGTSIGRFALSDDALTEGRVVLGIQNDEVDADSADGNRVTFADVEIISLR